MLNIFKRQQNKPRFTEECPDGLIFGPDEDGLADIVFGPDRYDPLAHLSVPPHTAAYAHMLERGEIQINGRILTHEDGDISAAELWPDATSEDLPRLMMEHIRDIGLIESVSEFYRSAGYQV